MSLAALSNVKQKMLVGILISTLIAASVYSETARDFVWTPQSEFQWWVEPQTKKINFRRCDFVDGQKKCFGPMLLKGIDLKDIPAMLSFYRERLDQSGNHQLKQFLRVLSGSIGTIAAYVGTLGSLSLLKHVVPPNVVEKASGFTLRTGVHIVSLGALSVLLYVGTDTYRHLNRQKKVYKIYYAAIGRNPQSPPEIALHSQALFDEFVSTFRAALQDFTHGGGTFDDNGYLIFQ